MSSLGTSWMFLIRVNIKVGMKWATVEEEEGVNILLKYFCCVVWRLHAVRNRSTPKNEIRHLRNGLVCELNVDERKLMRQAKTLCSNRRNQSFRKSRLHKLLGEN